MNETQSSGTEADNNEESKTPSDARIILGPLVKYAGIGFVLVAIIITTVVSLDRQFNDIDREVAELEAQLAAAHPAADANLNATEEPADQAVAVSETRAIQVSESEPEPSPAVDPTSAQETLKDDASKVIETPAVADASLAGASNNSTGSATVDTVIPARQAAVVEQVNQNEDSIARPDVFFDKSIEDLIKERNAYLNERDRIYLEEFKASQEKQLQLMRERLARQEQRIEEMEKRNQERYETRAADVMEMQQRREDFLSDRI